MPTTNELSSKQNLQNTSQLLLKFSSILAWSCFSVSDNVLLNQPSQSSLNLAIKHQPGIYTGESSPLTWRSKIPSFGGRQLFCACLWLKTCCQIMCHSIHGLIDEAGEVYRISWDLWEIPWSEPFQRSIAKQHSSRWFSLGKPNIDQCIRATNLWTSWSVFISIL